MPKFPKICSTPVSVLKPISGHTSCAPVQNYLEKNGRALAFDSWNIIDEKNWAQEMDEIRKSYDNNKSVNGKKTRTYNHYIISPDPRDNIDLETLRELTRTWCETYFNEFMCAMEYHNDNGILHAHIVINNTNILTGKRLAPYLTNRKVREVYNGLQEIGANLGLRGIATTKDEFKQQYENQQTLREISKKELTYEKNFISSKDYYSKKEQKLLKREGYSWKEDIRARVKIARETSTTEMEFIENVRKLGVKINAAKNGDYLFTHPDKKSWKVRGNTLGKDYSRNHVIHYLNYGNEKYINKPELWQLDRQIKSLSEGHARTIAYRDPKSNITLKEIAETLEINNKYNITTLQEATATMSALKNSEDYEKLQHAFQIGKETHIYDIATKRNIKKPVYSETKKPQSQASSSSPSRTAPAPQQPARSKSQER